MLDEIFQVARRESPTVIFIDEFDGIFGCKGETSLGRSLLKLLNIKLTQLVEEPCNVLLIGTTNNPWDLDPSNLSRFTLEYIGPPTASHAEMILRQNMDDFRKCIEDSEWKRLGEVAVAKVLSGRDLVAIVRRLWTRMKAVQHQGTFYKKVNAFLCQADLTDLNQTNDLQSWAPCKQDDDGATQCTYQQLPPGSTVVHEEIRHSHVLEAIEEHPSDTNSEQIQRYAKYARL